MLVENISEYEIQTHEKSEIKSLLNEFPTNTNILVVDTNFITLLNMKKIMKQYGYQVTVYSVAEEAIAFLTNCKHEINVVIWDYHMPGIHGLQALKIIGSKMDLPILIMSEDNQIDSVMKATMHGACDYVMKPVREETIANIWTHIVRKRMMSKPGLNQDNDDFKILEHSNNELNIDMTEEKASKKPRMTWIEEIRQIQSPNLVKVYGLDRNNNDGFNIMNQYSDEQNMDCKIEKKPRKTRMTWTRDLEHNFLQAIDLVGGIKNANPNILLKCMQDMKIQGLTRSNVSSHLQKHRINLEEKQMTSQEIQDIGWSNTSKTSSLHGLNNGHTSTTPFLMNDHQATYPVEPNPYQNGYSNYTNQFMANDPMPHIPYFDQQQPKYYPLLHQLSNVMNKKELEQEDFGIVQQDHHELIYPNEF
ncbi:unnamed protein product [Cochlearia groenlandica]